MSTEPTPDHIVSDVAVSAFREGRAYAVEQFHIIGEPSFDECAGIIAEKGRIFALAHATLKLGRLIGIYGEPDDVLSVATDLTDGFAAGLADVLEEYGYTLPDGKPKTP